MTDASEDKDARRHFRAAKPKGWRSAVELSRDFVGGSVDINRLLTHLRASLIDDITYATACSSDTAAEIVDAHLIGQKHPKRGQAALAASPDAERILGLTLRTNMRPSKPNGWRSAADLLSDYLGATRTINRSLTQLREIFINDLSVAGYGESAEHVVDTYLVGIKKPPSGQEAWAASVEAVRAAEDLGLLVPRRRQR